MFLYYMKQIILRGVIQWKEVHCWTKAILFWLTLEYFKSSMCNIFFLATTRK